MPPIPSINPNIPYNNHNPAAPSYPYPSLNSSKYIMPQNIHPSPSPDLTPNPGIHSGRLPHALSTTAPIILPTPIIRGRVLSLNSANRPWAQAPLRSTFTWNGPLPAMKDASYVAVTAVQTPAYVLDRHPSLVLRIKGVGDGETQTVLLPDLNASSRKWATWRPCEASTRYIYPLPTPWTVSLLDNYQQPVAMGADDVRGRLMGSVLYLPSAGEAAGIEKSEMLWIDGPQKRAQVAAVATEGGAGGAEERRLELSLSVAPTVRPETRMVDVLREEAQWCAFVEIQA